MSPTGAPFAYITGAAPGAIAGICSFADVTVACGAQSESATTPRASNNGITRPYLPISSSHLRWPIIWYSRQPNIIVAIDDGGRRPRCGGIASARNSDQQLDPDADNPKPPKPEPKRI